MRRFLFVAAFAVAFAVGMVSTIAVPTAQATGRCWAYCHSSGQWAICCPGVGCWLTGQPC